MQKGTRRFTCMAHCIGYLLAGDNEGRVVVFSQGACLQRLHVLQGPATGDVGEPAAVAVSGEARCIVGLARMGRGFAAAAAGGALSLVAASEGAECVPCPALPVLYCKLGK